MDNACHREKTHRQRMSQRKGRIWPIQLNTISTTYCITLLAGLGRHDPAAAYHGEPSSDGRSIEKVGVLLVSSKMLQTAFSRRSRAGPLFISFLIFTAPGAQQHTKKMRQGPALQAGDPWGVRPDLSM